MHNIGRHLYFFPHAVPHCETHADHSATALDHVLCTFSTNKKCQTCRSFYFSQKKKYKSITRQNGLQYTGCKVKPKCLCSLWLEVMPRVPVGMLVMHFDYETDAVWWETSIYRNCLMKTPMHYKPKITCECARHVWSSCCLNNQHRLSATRVLNQADK